MENNTFSYAYSAKENKEIEAIRSKYLPKEESKLERMKKLDAHVQSAGITESLIVGIVGALVFGVGMCIGLEALKGSMALAIGLGALGLLVMLTAYPVYRGRLAKAKRIYAPEILALADELSKN